eukprot:260476_1
MMKQYFHPFQSILKFCTNSILKQILSNKKLALPTEKRNNNLNHNFKIDIIENKKMSYNIELLQYGLIFILGLVSYKVYCTIKRQINNYPPGFDDFPIIGSLFHRTFERGSINIQFVGKTNVVQNYLFGKPFVAIRDVKLMRHVLKTENYRDSPFAKYQNIDSVSCFDLNNQVWQKGRKLNIQCLTQKQ